MAAPRVANKYPAQFGSILLGSFIGVNLNLGTNVDQFIAFPDTPTRCRIRSIAMTNGSINPSTARFTINTAAAGGGVNIVSTVTPSLASAAVVQDLSIASTNTITNAGGLYLYLTTPQSAAATVDIYIYGDIYLG